ncbi:MAG: aconitate hydratase [Oscillospiraceae bacterium]|nr:aconitate hydratase [Oscillospiraceae bacterium]
MGRSITRKILENHLVQGDIASSPELGIRIDQTLTQDATGTMAYLQFEAMGIARVKTELSVAYVDHNTLQSGFENADDHAYIQSVAKKHGIRYSRPGNGICHQVHLERFGVPGKTLIGSDSHTPTGGGIGMLAFGAGGLDVAVAMGGGVYYIANPKVVNVRLHGSLQRGVSAKDIILEVLRRLSVKGGVGKVMEYTGDGVASLSVPERATITNMGAELGATTSVFPSDAVTKACLEAQGRGGDYAELLPDADAVYDEGFDLDLTALAPLVACPHMPDNVKPVTALAGMRIDQVCIGSCTNSSLYDMLKVAQLLRGKTVADNVSLVIAPGSRQVLEMLSDCGALTDILASGARVLECACGPCIGMGQAPASGGVSLRTFNRNFEGRSGTKDAQLYLVSPETAAVSAVAGVLTDPRPACAGLSVTMPAAFKVSDNMVLLPADAADADGVEVRRGPNIKPFPLAQPLEDTVAAPVTLKVGDNITTDHIMPAGAKLLPLRSNIPAMSQYCFTRCDESFPARAKAAGSGIIVAGANYGQGSSREHAALVPLYLGTRAILAKSFARIHRDNLVNAGILPLVFRDEADFDRIALGDTLSLADIRAAVAGADEVTVADLTKGFRFTAALGLTARQREILLAGGLINLTRQKAEK